MNVEIGGAPDEQAAAVRHRHPDRHPAGTVTEGAEGDEIRDEAVPAGKVALVEDKATGAVEMTRPLGGDDASRYQKPTS